MQRNQWRRPCRPQDSKGEKVGAEATQKMVQEVSKFEIKIVR